MKSTVQPINNQALRYPEDVFKMLRRQNNKLVSTIWVICGLWLTSSVAIAWISRSN